MKPRPDLIIFRCALTFTALLFAAGCQHTAPTPDAPARVVAFGDSITRGYNLPVGTAWVDVLAARLERAGRPVAVYNAGGNGNTSAEGQRRLNSEVLIHLPGLVLVEFGGNDAVEGERHVTADDFDRNLTAIHEAVTARGGRTVLLTFPPVIDDWHSAGRSPYYLQRGGLDREVERYRQRTREVAARLGVPLFDLDHFLRELIKASGPAAYIHRDGVHLTPEGNRVVAEAVKIFLVTEGLIAAR